MNHVQVELLRAKELISDPKRWTTGAYARNTSGVYTSPVNDNAVCFCALGAMDAVESGSRAFNALYEAAYQHGGITHINDVSGHHSVMAMFDRAVEIAGRR
jgi:hypothetical protein